jgi:hypothetical protein
MPRAENIRAIELRMLKLLLQAWKQASGLIVLGGILPTARLWDGISSVRFDDDEDDLWRVAEQLSDWFEAQVASGASGTVDITDPLLQRAMRLAEQLPFGNIPVSQQITGMLIERQMNWLRLLLGYWLEKTNLKTKLVEIGNRIDSRTAAELGRVLKINIRKEIPGIQFFIDRWRDDNVQLIQSGIMAPHISDRLRPSLLASVSKTVESAHAKGLRVEELMEQLQHNFAVGKSRASLIARDQVLKLNGQVKATES